MRPLGKSARWRCLCVLAVASALLVGVHQPSHASSYSKGPAGTKVLYLLLADLGYRVERAFSVEGLGKPSSGNVALWIGQQPKHFLGKAYAWVRAGGTMVLAPPLMDETGHCKDFAFGPLTIERKLRFDKEHTSQANDDKLLVRKAACVAKPSTGTALAFTKEGAIVYEQQLGAGRLLVLSHDDLLSNLALDQDDVAVIFRRWLGQHASFRAKAIFIEKHAGGALWHMLKRAKLVPLVLHGLFFLVLLYWRLTPRFGDADPFVPSQRRAFAEHARTLGGLYHSAGASGHVLAAQYERFLRRLRLNERLRGKGSEAKDATQQQQDVERLAALIATRTGNDQQEIATVLRRTQLAAAQRHRRSAKEMRRDVALGRSLYQLAQKYEGGPTADAAEEKRKS